MPRTSADVILVGAGHNNLVAAALLAMRGLKVIVLETRKLVGGACITDRPFKKDPDQRVSRFAYLLGPMPSPIEAALGIKIPTRRRDPHYFVPLQGDRYLLFGSDQAAMHANFTRFFSEQDWMSSRDLENLIATIRQYVQTAWLKKAMTLEQTADRYLPSGRLQDQFIKLCRGSIGDFLMQWQWSSMVFPGTYAITDGFTSAYGTWDTPGTGYNFLCHNMVGGDGIWKVVAGGMGTVTRLIADKARQHGADIRISSPVQSILHQGGQVQGVMLEDGSSIYADIVVCGCDPWRIRDMVGAPSVPAAFNDRLAGYAEYPGSSCKINLSLSGEPEFTCLPGDHGQFRTTTHLLPLGGDMVAAMKLAFEQCKNGVIPDRPMVELMWHTQVDPTLRGASGHHVAGLFLQWIPRGPFLGSDREANEEILLRRALAICDEFAPNFSSLVVDADVLTPVTIEEQAGITGGHICHIDNRHMFADSDGVIGRVPVFFPGFDGLVVSGSSAHPGGCVTGATGFIAGNAVLEDLLGLPGFVPQWN